MQSCDHGGSLLKPEDSGEAWGLVLRASEEFLFAFFD